MNPQFYQSAPVHSSLPRASWWVNFSGAWRQGNVPRTRRRAHSDPARRSTPWKNGLSTWFRRPAQLRELRGGHVPNPFYPASRVSRRSQARLSERPLRPESAADSRRLTPTSRRRETCGGSEPASGASQATDGKTLRRGDCRSGHGPPPHRGSVRGGDPGPDRVASPQLGEVFSRAVERFAEPHVSRRFRDTDADPAS
jgi:hypothetical protein